MGFLSSQNKENEDFLAVFMIYLIVYTSPILMLLLWYYDSSISFLQIYMLSSAPFLLIILLWLSIPFIFAIAHKLINALGVYTQDRPNRERAIQFNQYIRILKYNIILSMPILMSFILSSSANLPKDLVFVNQYDLFYILFFINSVILCMIRLSLNPSIIIRNYSALLAESSRIQTAIKVF